MSVRLDKIIPWGRTMHEYERMFGLSEADLRGGILGCGDGPASFNAEMTQRGFPVVSCDPIYIFNENQIHDQFKASIEPVMSQVRAHPQNYVWTYHQDPDDLLRHRTEAMRLFLADYSAGRAHNRYIAAELPKLPFPNDTFNLAVCSHLLFLYSEKLSLEFHMESILELCRVASEVRIFPLTALDCELSPHLVPLQEELRHRGLRVETVKVNYQLQRNGNQMMRVER